MGKYGPDALSFFLIILGFIVSGLTSMTGILIIAFVGYALIILGVLRMLSKNFARRSSENEVFLAMLSPLGKKIKQGINKSAQRRDYRFFKCPGCKNTLRVPKNRGRIQITCPKCGERFERKS
ncbi:MAG: hypothetical protein IJG63_08100 [Oscillospiraceae bacterium]|nr:hypothetical protein [Oscillospiraceae bacterium]